jgi:amino acid transporter
LIIASVTFVAYEGFQLVTNAVNEMEKPEKSIPLAIYSAIFLAVLIYPVISLGAILAIPLWCYNSRPEIRAGSRVPTRQSESGVMNWSLLARFSQPVAQSVERYSVRQGRCRSSRRMVIYRHC